MKPLQGPTRSGQSLRALSIARVGRRRGACLENQEAGPADRQDIGYNMRKRLVWESRTKDEERKRCGQAMCFSTDHFEINAHTYPSGSATKASVP